MRKPAICLCNNKGADQLRGYCEADLHLWFLHHADSRFSQGVAHTILAMICL